MPAVSLKPQEFAAAKLCLDHIGLCSHSVLLHKGLIRAQLHEMRTKESDLQPYQLVLATMSNLYSTLQELLDPEGPSTDETVSAAEHDQEPGGQKRARTHDDVVDVRGQGPCEWRAGRQLQVDAADSARHCVLSNGDLVQHVMSMLAGSFTASREDVGRLSLVCRLWRDVGRREAIWRPISMELLPVLDKRGGRVVVGIEQGVRFREYLQSYGRALVERRVSDEPLKGVDLHLELWDQMDGATLCSGVGPADATIGAQGETWLQLGDGARYRNRITAADRDPEQHRYANFEDFVQRAHEADMPSRIRLRVMVRDRSSGRMVLLWESGKEVQLTPEQVEPEEDELAAFVVRTPTKSLYTFDGSDLRANGEFHVVATPQPGVDELHLKWVSKHVYVTFHAAQAPVVRFIKSALRM